MNNMKIFDTAKKKLAWLVLGSTALAAPLVVNLSQPDPVVYETLVWEKPTNDQEWSEDTKKEGLNTRLDFQLEEMKASHEDKLIILKQLYEKATNFPDAIRWEVLQQGLQEPELTEEVNKRISSAKLDYERMQQVVERLNKEIELRHDKKVDRKADILKTQASTEKERKELTKLKEKK